MLRKLEKIEEERVIYTQSLYLMLYCVVISVFYC